MAENFKKRTEECKSIKVDLPLTPFSPMENSMGLMPFTLIALLNFLSWEKMFLLKRPLGIIIIKTNIDLISYLKRCLAKANPPFQVD